jgi:RecJ-like exonuclease
MKDRNGFERCGGYKQEDFIVCPKCNGNIRKKNICKTCGGYGEISKESHNSRCMAWMGIIITKINKLTTYIKGAGK